MNGTLIPSAFLVLALGIGQEHTSEAEALRVLDEFMANFNNRDHAAMAALFHFPHVRIAHGEVFIWNSAEEFLAARTPADQERFVRATGWHRTEWDSREVIQVGERKVHIAVRFTRYREDGSVIGAYNSLYIVTKRNGRWGIQARSSYVP
jgi:hypothetical protein